jgi:Lsr2
LLATEIFVTRRLATLDVAAQAIICTMAKNVTVVTTDDLDGSAGAETVSFSLGGVNYEMDLGSENRARLAESFAPAIAAGRRVSRTGRVASRRSVASADLADVRAWARETGLPVSDRGRISGDLMKQYEAAH